MSEEPKLLFSQWSGNSYEWDALTDIEQQRWIRLSEKHTAALAAKDAEIARSIRNNEALVVENEEQRAARENAIRALAVSDKAVLKLRQQLTAAEAAKAELREQLEKKEELLVSLAADYSEAVAGETEMDELKRLRSENTILTTQLEEVKRDRDKKRSILGGIRDALFAAGFTDPQGDSRAEVQTLTTERDSLRTALAEAEKARDAAKLDMERLTELESNCWTLECYDSPTPGGDDAQEMWRVIEYHMAKPRERYIGFGSTPRSAIDSARSTPPAP